MRANAALHGTRTRYSYGCRCPFCTQANSEYKRDYRHGVRLRRQDETAALIRHAIYLLSADEPTLASEVLQKAHAALALRP